MILLTTPASKLQLNTSAAGAIAVQASWVDASGATITPGGANLASITAAATTDVVAGPAASTQRNVKDLSVRNTSATVANTVTLIHTDSVNAVEKFKCTLAAGETLVYDQGGDFQVYDAKGTLKTANTSPGTLIAQTVLTSGTALTTSAATTKVRARLRAGGGGGGGSTSSAAAAACAGGGAQGGYAEKLVLGVSPGAILTYAIGAAGAPGIAGATGGTGGNTVITINGVTITANGGPGGAGLPAVAAATFTLGGAAPAPSTGADFNSSGAPGEMGIQVSGTVGAGGRGGGEGAGNARSTAGAGNSATTSSGAGGGGGCVLNGSTAVGGGSGASGVIIVEEFA
jgi:hypothetical protein